MIRKLLAGLALGLGAAGLVLLLGWTGVLDTPELWTYDWRIRRAADPSSLHKDIVFVEFNDTTIRDLAPYLGRWPWPRVVYASFIDYLSRAPAKVIAVDFAFLEPDGTLGAKIGDTTITAKESDAALVESVRQSRSVVLLADAVYQGTVERDQATAPAEWRNRSPKFHLGPAIEERPIVIPPFQELTDVAAGARTQQAGFGSGWGRAAHGPVHPLRRALHAIARRGGSAHGARGTARRGDADGHIEHPRSRPSDSARARDSAGCR